MNSGRSNGAFWNPRFPARYFLFAFQCLGTGTVCFADFKHISNLGSLAVTSCISTTSGRVTSCFNSATVSRLSFRNFFFDNAGWPKATTHTQSKENCSSQQVLFYCIGAGSKFTFYKRDNILAQYFLSEFALAGVDRESSCVMMA